MRWAIFFQLVSLGTMGATIVFGGAVLAALSYFFRQEILYMYNHEKLHFEQEVKNSKLHDKHYDFIIVGGGTAGCLLAYRLSKHHEVLLLEEGRRSPPIAEVPAFRPYLDKFVSSDLLFGSESTYGLLIYNRGSRYDYDNWAKLTKDAKWKFRKIYKVYKKLKNYTGPFPSYGRGVSGPIPIRTSNPPVLVSYVGGAKELGINYGDANNGQEEGLSPVDFTEGNGRAVSTCSLFIDPILGIRKSLTVIAYSEVEEILFKSNTAIGVKYIKFEKEFTAYAKKEVILSLGPIATPVLLFKSGVGPTKILAKAKIPIVKDLPVGSQIQYHQSLVFNITVKNQAKLVTLYYNLTELSFESYLNGSNNSILSEVGYGPEGFFVSNRAKSSGESKWPDIQFSRGNGQFDPTGTNAYIPITIAMTRPLTKGELQLDTKAYKNGEKDKLRLALIKYDLFKHKEDRKGILEGIKAVFKLYATKPLMALEIETVPDGVCSKKHEVESGKFWDCVIKTYTTITNPGATCPMGYGSEDKNAVVDTKFRVIGLHRLRIVDSSVFPKLTNSNSLAPTIMIAEVAAKKILKSFKRKTNS